MNQKPHVHEAQLRWEDGAGAIMYRWEIKYGDQTQKLWRWPFGKLRPTPKRVAKVTARVVRRHDRESVKAGNRDEMIREAIKVHSDWYEGSDEQKEALEIERMRNERQTSGFSTYLYPPNTTVSSGNTAGRTVYDFRVNS